MPSSGRQAVYKAGKWQLDLGRRELRAGPTAVPLGSRAVDILEALVQSAGELVSKQALAQRVWPGVHVEENTLHVHISAIRKAFGTDRAMLRTASGKGYRLTGAWIPHSEDAPGSSSFPAPEALGKVPASQSLPIPGSPLIGRTTAIQELRDRLSAYRVVTLTGPGGIGKTRLAIEAARAELPAFNNLACIVELGSIVDPALAPATVAAALGTDTGIGELTKLAIARAIGVQRLLLVLDNCEHVIEAAASVAETVIRMCPNVTILATSREALQIEGECICPVGPLDMPPAGGSTVVEHSAAALFIARLKSQNPEVATNLGLADLNLIGAICRRLDGIPLAIELAAARAASLGITSVSIGLDNMFAVLVRGRRTALPRHQTLQATIDWSFALLTAEEQTCLVHLATFTGGFTMQAAAAVLGGLHGSPEDVSTEVANLVAKSLVIFDPMENMPRWRLLETTRAYAREKLRQSGAARTLAVRHAAYYRGLCAAPAMQALPQYRREIDNIRGALDWAFGPDGDRALGISLTVAAVPIWCQLSLLVECRDRVERALAGLECDQDARLRMELTAALGFAMTNSTGLLQETRVILEQALHLAEATNDIDYQLRALWSLWTVCFNAGELRHSRTIADTFIRLADSTGAIADRLVGNRLRGVTLHYLGEQDAARASLEEMLHAYRGAYLEEHRMRLQFDQTILARAVLARVDWIQGFPDTALSTTKSNIDAALAEGHVLSLCYALAEGACPIALQAREFETAQHYIDLLLTTAKKHDLPFWASWGECHAADLATRRRAGGGSSSTISAALDRFHAGGWATRIPDFLEVQARALGNDGHVTEALTVIDAALALTAQEGERWSTPDLLRHKAVLLLQQGRGSAPEQAEALLDAAVTMARQHGSLMLELRATLTRARLRHSLNRRDAVAEVAAICARFTEGFENADLKEARVFLETPASSHGERTALISSS